LHRHAEDQEEETMFYDEAVLNRLLYGRLTRLFGHVEVIYRGESMWASVTNYIGAKPVPMPANQPFATPAPSPPTSRQAVERLLAIPTRDSAAASLPARENPGVRGDALHAPPPAGGPVQA
jgi:hypothetical protein